MKNEQHKHTSRFNWGYRYVRDWKEGVGAHGYGKEYSYDDDDQYEVASYEGWFKDGKRDGRGKDYSNGELRYEGWFEDGQRNGFGHTFNPGGALYDRNGYSTHEGLFNRGRRAEYWLSGELVYDGDFKDGKRHGQGKEYWLSGELVYDGDFKDDERHDRASSTSPTVNSSTRGCSTTDTVTLVIGPRGSESMGGVSCITVAIISYTRANFLTASAMGGAPKISRTCRWKSSNACRPS